MESKSEGSSLSPDDMLAVLKQKDALQEELAKYKDELIKYKSAMEKALPKLKEQKSQLDTTKQDNTQLVEKVKSLETKVANLVEERIMLNNNTAAISNELATMQQKFDEKTRQLAAVRAEVGGEIESSSDASGPSSRSGSDVPLIVARMQQIKQFLDAKTTECQTQAARVVDLEKQVAYEASKNKEIVEKSKELVKGLKDKLMTVSDTLQTKNSQLLLELNEATKKIELQSRHESSKDSENTLRNTATNDLNLQITELEAKLKEAEKKAADSEASSKAVEADKKKAADELKASTDAVKQLEAKLKEAEKKAADSEASSKTVEADKKKAADELKASTDAVKQLEAKLKEAEKKAADGAKASFTDMQSLRNEVSSQSEQLAKDREFIDKSKALVRGLKEKARLASEKLKVSEHETSALARQVATFTQWRLASLAAPTGQLTIKLRCADSDGEVWSLVRRPKVALEREVDALVGLAQGGHSADGIVGVGAETVTEWLRAVPGEAPTVQEDLQRQFAAERGGLLAHIEALNGDKETTQRAFDLFRERAKGSLKKSAADQIEQTEKADLAERERRQLSESLLAARARAARAEAEAAALAAQLKSSRSSLQEMASSGIRQAASLRTSTLDLRRDVQDCMGAQAEALFAAMGHDLQRRLLSGIAPSAATFVAQDATARLSAADAREAKMRAELKKRGDAARDMLAEKEREISELKSAVSSAAATAVVRSAPVAVSSAKAPASDAYSDAEILEREQRMVYLKQAFCGLFKAHDDLDMKHMARVMCSILSVSQEDQNGILTSIDRYHIVMKYAPAKGVVTTVDSITSNIASLFG